MKSRSAGLVWWLLLVACRTVPVEPVGPRPAPAAEPIRLTIVGTNDLHGWVMPSVETVSGQSLRAGGVAAFSGYLKLLRADNPGGVLLLDGGDLFQGTLASNLTEGKVVIAAYNLLGYDGTAIGNHEFDYGPAGPAVTATSPQLDPFGALKERIAQANFPLLSANIYEQASGQRPDWLANGGLRIVERRGVKIGLFGLTTPQTPTTTMPLNVSSLRFAALAPEALAASTRLKEQGAEVVIALVHAGGKCSEWKVPTDTSSCDTGTAEVFSMLQGLPAGTLDAVVAGHTHALVAHVFRDTPVIESFALGKAFGLIELFVDPTTRAVDKALTRITPAVAICETMDEATAQCDPRALKGAGAVKVVPATFRGRPVEIDPQVASTVQTALDQVTELQHKKLGLQVPATLGRDYDGESPLGSFFADSLRRAEKADVALVNPGGLRADLRAGELTYGQVFEVIPFDNAIATLELTGDELKRLLAAAYGARKGVMQVAGLEVKLSKCVAPGRFKSATLEGGRPIVPAAHYRVVMSDFLAHGGDGLGPVLGTIDPRRVDLGLSREQGMRDSLVAHWQAQNKPLVAPKPGRVSIVSDGLECPSDRAVEAPADKH